MDRSTLKRNETKRMDALLALPLERFRRALAGLTLDELSALESRIALQRVRSRWARGGIGVARHRSSHELGLLARRETAVRHERDTRLAAAPAPIQLVFPETAVAEMAEGAIEEQAA